MINNNTQKNIARLLGTLVLIATVFLGVQSFAAPGDPAGSPLNAGNASQAVEQIKLGGSNLSGGGQSIGLDVSVLQSVSSFAMPGNTLAILGNLLVAGNTRVGDIVDFSPISIATGLPVQLPVNELNIDGTFLSSSLEYTDPEPQKNLCVDEAGVIQLCSYTPPTPTYGWAVSAWGACVSGTRTRTVTCQESPSGNTVSDSLCTNPKPVGTSACSNTGTSCNVPSDCTTAGETCVGASVRPAGGCTGTYFALGSFIQQAYAAPRDVDLGPSGPPLPIDPTGPQSCTRFTSQNSCLSRIGCSWAPPTYQVTNPGTCQARNSCFFGNQPNPDFSNTPVDASGNVPHFGMVCTSAGNRAPASVMQNSGYNNAGPNYRYACDDGQFRPIGAPGNATCSLDAPPTIYIGADGELYEDYWIQWTQS